MFHPVPIWSRSPVFSLLMLLTFPNRVLLEKYPLLERGKAFFSGEYLSSCIVLLKHASQLSSRKHVALNQVYKTTGYLFMFWQTASNQTPKDKFHGGRAPLLSVCQGTLGQLHVSVYASIWNTSVGQTHDKCFLQNHSTSKSGFKKCICKVFFFSWINHMLK